MLRELGKEEDLERELAFTMSLLQRDVMNNSAWSQRAFLMDLRSGSGAEVDWSAEFAMTTESIKKCVENEASWAYLAYVARNSDDRVRDDLYPDFIGAMLDEHRDSVEVGSAAFGYYKDLRSAETDDIRRETWTVALKLLRDTLVRKDPRRAHRWNLA